MGKTGAERLRESRERKRQKSVSQSLQRLGCVNTPENEEEVQMASSILQDATAALQTTKRKRSNDARTATQVSLSFLCGEKVTGGRLKSKVSKKLGINRKRLSTAFRARGSAKSASPGRVTCSPLHLVCSGERKTRM